MTETLTRIWCDLTARQDIPDHVAEAGYDPDDVEAGWESRTLDAEAARVEVQQILDGGTVNYDLGRGSFLSAVLGAELVELMADKVTVTDDGRISGRFPNTRRVVLCEWRPDEGWAPPATPAPVAVLLAAHHQPATEFEVAAYGELLLGLHTAAPDHRCPAWCADCADDEGTGDCDTAAVVTELEAL